MAQRFLGEAAECPEPYRSLLLEMDRFFQTETINNACVLGNYDRISQVLLVGWHIVGIAPGIDGFIEHHTIDLQSRAPEQAEFIMFKLFKEAAAQFTEFSKDFGITASFIEDPKLVKKSLLGLAEASRGWLGNSTVSVVGGFTLCKTAESTNLVFLWWNPRIKRSMVEGVMKGLLFMK